MTITLLAIVFWICVLAVITPYVVYPTMLFAFSRFRNEVHPGQYEAATSLVISAYNEAAVIRDKIENSLALNSPGQSLEIVVISDESDDGTDDIVREFDDTRVKLYRQSPREGKSAALTRFVPQCTGEIIVFSDANSVYDRDAVQKLVRHFGDPTVGFVVGHQRYSDGEGAASQSENTYWGFEVKLKSWESRLSSVVGGDGAIMAIRRELFSPLKKDDINDFLIPLRIVVAGYRGVFEPEAFCYEESAPNFAGEFRRKIRIVNRSFRAVFRARSALNPIRVGIFSWQLFSHKVIRWMAPLFLMGCFVTCLLLAANGSALYQALMIAQVTFYLVAAARFLPSIGELKIVYLCYFFCLSNVAAALGMMNILLGRRFSTWTPQRPETTK
ncbi:MAG: glycosyltransferase family 2 protein [Planctomycetales bacterium]|nr:glycosyltransferase family 2 protein [Planctomycetales bacterium]